MILVLKNSWALLFGILLLMVGNGLQGTLLGVRGEMEGFSTMEMSIVMSSYFVGFLGASRMVPDLIRRVGHVRVFAALASFVSAVLILYPAWANPWAWAVGRVIIGFAYCGVYVTAESWLNNAATNETRGQALSAYMIATTLGIIVAQGLLLLADPGGYTLFIIISVLVSVSFAPILLSISPTPAFDSTAPMQLTKLLKTSPLGCVGMFLMGGIFAAQFGMSAVFATKIGLGLAQLSTFVAAFYVGGLILQYPIGWLSDRMDRRALICIIASAGAIAALLPLLAGTYFYLLLVSAFVIGGMSNPLYSLLIAHTNDFVAVEDMAASSSGLLFINGLGAILGPIVVGQMMDLMGAQGFFVIIVVLLGLLGGYAAYRRTRRAAVEDTMTYANVSPTSSMMAVESAQDYAIETAAEEEAAT
jgi:MFS family permease